eukprot:SAG31_NODE_32424_length_356_cov_0.677043_1_plen_29_part_10
MGLRTLSFLVPSRLFRIIRGLFVRCGGAQ